MGGEIRFRLRDMTLDVEERVAENMLRHLILLPQHWDDDVGECVGLSFEAPVVDDGIRPVCGLDPFPFAAIESSTVRVQDVEDRHARSDSLEVGWSAEFSSH